jgi:hypothetical protein
MIETLCYGQAGIFITQMAIYLPSRFYSRNLSTFQQWLLHLWAILLVRLVKEH